MTGTVDVPTINSGQLKFRTGIAQERFTPLAKEIYTLKEQLNAVILAHNYQVPEIQGVTAGRPLKL